MVAKRRGPVYKRKRYAYKKALAPTVRRIMSSVEEKKWVSTGGTKDFLSTPTLYGLLQDTTSGGLIPVSALVSGTDVNQRIGNRIRLKEISIAFDIQPVKNSTMGDGASIRIALAHDKRPAGAMPNFAGFFDSTGLAWLQNNQNITRFKILKQMQHQMVVTTITQSDGNVAGCGPALQFIWTIRPNKIVSWSSGANLIANLITDNWYLITQSDQSGCCKFNYQLQLKYTDC